VIRAMIFYLDGTLIQMERLKALSDARTAIEPCPFALTEREEMAGFKKESVSRAKR